MNRRHLPHMTLSAMSLVMIRQSATRVVRGGPHKNPNNKLVLCEMFGDRSYCLLPLSPYLSLFILITLREIIDK